MEKSITVRPEYLYPLTVDHKRGKQCDVSTSKSYSIIEQLDSDDNKKEYANSLEQTLIDINSFAKERNTPNSIGAC